MSALETSSAKKAQRGEGLEVTTTTDDLLAYVG